MAESTEQALIRVIRQQMGDDRVDLSFLSSLSEEEATKLYALARSQDLVQFVGSAVGKDGTFGNDELKKTLLTSTMMLVRRFTLQEYELQSVRRVLDGAAIAYIPLKGAVLCTLYPIPWLRSRGDLDILVHEADIERASLVLTDGLGYTKEGTGSHDVSFRSKSGIHVELHFSLLEENRIGRAEKPLLQVWDHAKPDGGCGWQMTDEMAYYYHMAHAAKHITNGGCGMRPFIDTWVLNHKVDANRERREALLAQGGLLAFARASERLAEVWLGDAAHDKVTRALDDYVVRGGVYGNLENQAAVKRTQYKSRFGVAMRHIFLPYTALAMRFPRLKKRPWLMPAYEVWRWVLTLTEHRVENGARKWRANRTLSEERVEDVTQLLHELKLDIGQ